MADVDRCVVCGSPIPEGRMLCWWCSRVLLEKNCESCKWHGVSDWICHKEGSDYYGKEVIPAEYCLDWEPLMTLKDLHDGGSVTDG